MLMILLTAIFVALVLVAILWTGTVVAQGYIYDSPTDGLYWRAPAGAGAIALFLLIWMLIEYRKPGATDTLFNFSSSRSSEFIRFVSVRKTETGEEQEIPYERHTAGTGRVDFRDPKGTIWARSSSGMMVAIIIDENGEKKRFNADMKDGKFVTPRPNEPLRYREENGRRYILENELGKIYSTSRAAWFLVLFINLLHFAVWFAVLWPLLRFQWSHALGFAAICWLIVTLVLTPYMLGRARSAAEKKAKPPKAAASIDWPARPLLTAAGASLSRRGAIAFDCDRGRKFLA